jgi:hypothetical protein
MQSLPECIKAIPGKSVSAMAVPVSFALGGEYYINRNVWKLSPTTSKHINSSFPELKGVNIDSVGFPPYHFVVDDDYQIEKSLTRLLGGVK